MTEDVITKIEYHLKKHLFAQYIHKKSKGSFSSLIF